MKKIVVFGGTGFIGGHLVELLRKEYEIIIPTRNPEQHRERFQHRARLVVTGNPNRLAPYFEGAAGIVNLAGENVGSRWTKQKKQAIYNSRIQTDHLICKTFEKVKTYPEAVLQGSGMGVYGTETSDEPVTEFSPLGTSGFLTKTGIDHEKALDEIADKTRIVYLRTGLVMDGKEGSFPKFIAPFRFFAGGPMGSGKQWISWITVDDEVAAIKFLLEHPSLQGAFNLTAPNPLRQKEMAAVMGKALHRPAIMRTPAFLLKAMLKDMAVELIMNGKKVLPKRLTDAGFTFKHEDFEQALHFVLNRNPNR